MLCPKCGFDDPQSFAFCGRCGTSTTLTVPVGAKDGQLARAERRQLSVMFCDLVGSTILSGRLDPEELSEITRSYHALCAEVIERHAGRVAQFMGDGLLAYFGYPQSHEDDAQRAVRAGLEIVAAVAAARERLGQALQVRIGVHTGLAVVGQLGGETNPDPMAISGETPNIAARLQSIAELGGVVISAATYKLVQGFFVCRSLGIPALKGVVAPPEAFEVLKPTGIHTRFEKAVAAGLTSFVSREQETGQLLELWQRAQGSHGQVVLLCGEAGIGKSRLVRVLTEHTAGESALELACRCSPYYQNSALYPAIEFLQRMLRFTPNDDPGVKLAKLEAALAQVGFSLPEMVPLFAALLSLPADDRYPALPLSPLRQKQKTFETIIEWLLRNAEQVPTRLVVEDLHWADPSTLELIELLIERVSTAPILLLLVFRPDFTPPWRVRPHVTNLILGRLSIAAVQSVIQSVAGGKQLPAELTDQIIKKTEGVPLFVEELTRMVLESDMIHEWDGRYVLASALPALAIPSTLYDSLMARLDRLGAAKDVAQLAATIGREFSYDLLRAVSPLEEARLTGALNRLVDAELLEEYSSAVRLGYRFKHALIRDAAYNSLLRSQRRQYHHRLAEVLRAQFADTIEAWPGIVANHLTEAGLIEDAIPWWQKAGQRALERSANQEAIRHLTNGLDLLAQLPDTSEHRGQELLLLATLGPAMMAAKGLGSLEAQKVYARAQQLSQEVGSSPVPFQIAWALWVSHSARAEHDAAVRAARECLRLAKLADEPALLVAAHHAISNALLCLGRFAECLSHMEQGAAIYDTRHHAYIVGLCGQDSGVVCHAFRGWPLWFLGYPDQARKCIGEGSALAQKLAHPLTTVTASYIAGCVYPLLRDPQAALQEAELALSLSEEHQFEYWRATALMVQGWAFAEQGLLDNAIMRLREGLTSLHASGGEVGMPYYIAMLADALGKAGHGEEALSLLAEAQAILEKTGENWWEPELLRLKADVMLQRAGRRHDSEAEISLRRALAIAHERDAKSLELRAATSLSRLLFKQGRKSEAHRTLAAVYSWFTEGFDTPDLQEAKALIEQLA